MNHHFISAALFLRELRAREIHPRPLARRRAGDSSRSASRTQSDADRRLTRKIQEVGRIVEISLLDHVIVGAPEAGGAAYFSFKEAGLL